MQQVWKVEKINKFSIRNVRTIKQKKFVFHVNFLHLILFPTADNVFLLCYFYGLLKWTCLTPEAEN